MVDQSRLRKWAAWVIAVITGIGAFVAWLAGITVDVPQALPTWQGFARSIRGDIHAIIFYLVLFGLTAANLWLWVTGRRRREPESPPASESAPTDSPAEKPEPPTPIPPPPEAMASHDSAERLLEIVRHWEHAFSYAVRVLKHEVCNHEPGASREIELLAYAIRRYPLESSTEMLVGLTRRFEDFAPRNLPQSTFKELLFLARNTVPACNYHFVFWINNGGAAIHGEKLFSSAPYLSFYQTYEDALKGTANHRFHTELGPLVRAILEMETRPAKPTDPGPSTASGPGQQP